MAHPHIETMRTIDEAQQRGDIAGLFAQFTDDVVIHIAGRNKLSGEYRGKQDLESLFGRFMEAMGDDYAFENHGYLADDDHGVTLQTSRSTRAGKTLDLQEVFLMHFRDGKVSEMWYIPVDQAALDAWIG